MSTKDLRQLLRKAEKAGCTVTMTGKEHLKVTAPSGQVVIVAGTTDSHRAVKNARAQLRRIGVDV